MSEICGNCGKYKKDDDYPPKFMGWCSPRGKLVAYYSIPECGMWEPAA